ncbi:MAG: 30S ribosome-binding factor RbfA [Candidatus Riflebacteria bacterium]|nr:30S ribosome-binding factor RbfA [Candidatus Riflebacteria bacterium]
MDRTIARIERDLLRRVSQILQEVEDPRIPTGFVALSRTTISRDLRIIKCYVMVNRSEPEQRTVMLALNRARKFVRHRLGERLAMRHTPEVRFYLDDTPERAQRIDEILDSLRTEAEEAPPAYSLLAEPASDEA